MSKNMIHDAIVFATMAHKGQVRKGTDIDYISHPMEVLQILTAIKAGESVQIAGILHDVVEDTDYKLEDIKERFGERVADLVESHTEKDKGESWKVRKNRALEELKRADKNVKMLIFADKLANMRSIADDYSKVGEKLWDRFNADKNDIDWYYSTSIDCFFNFQFDENIKSFYWEFNQLYKDVFIHFYVDEEKGILYQLNDGIERYYLEKGNPEWKSLKEEVSKDAVELERKDAENLEDKWNVTYFQMIKKELENAEYEIYSGEGRSMKVRVHNEEISFDGEDWGSDCEGMNGNDEYEYHFLLDKYNSQGLVERLHLTKSLDKPFEKLLKEEFGNEIGSNLFRQFLEKENIAYTFSSY